jgi:hypothetical protein
MTMEGAMTAEPDLADHLARPQPLELNRFREYRSNQCAIVIPCSAR